MPTYAYKCRDCETPLEVHQEFSDAPLTVCPTCGGTLRKQYGSVGVTFNGSGFYRTDSRANDSKPAAAKSDSGSSDSGTSESKPAAKGDSPSKPASDAKPAAKPAATPAS